MVQARVQQTLVPRNGRFLVAMMVGAPADRARELRDRLAETRGILVQYHLDYERAHGAFQIPRVPEDVDLILVIKSQLGHSKFRGVQRVARRYRREHDGVEIPVIHTTHKWTSLSTLLNLRFGIKQQQALPLAVTSTAYFRAPRLEPANSAGPETPKPPIMPSSASVEAPPKPRCACGAEWDGVGQCPACVLRVEQELRRKFLRTDTLALVRELQARLPLAGIKTITLTPTEMMMDARPMPEPTAASPAEPARTTLSVVTGGPH